MQRFLDFEVINFYYIYMSYEFNHTFMFVDKDFPEESLFRDSDLICTMEREHLGQGTSAKFIMFPDNYLEFIWMSNKDDAKKNLIPIQEKANWKTSGWNPFGIAFSGHVPENEKKYFEEYSPDYNRGKSIWIDKRSIENKEWPLLFFMEPAKDLGPKSYRPSVMLKDRPEAAISKNCIKQLTYHGPKFEVPSYAKSSLISFVDSNSYLMEIILKSSVDVISSELFKIS